MAEGLSTGGEAAGETGAAFSRQLLGEDYLAREAERHGVSRKRKIDFKFAGSEYAKGKPRDEVKAESRIGNSRHGSCESPFPHADVRRLGVPKVRRIGGQALPADLVELLSAEPEIPDSAPGVDDIDGPELWWTDRGVSPFDSDAFDVDPDAEQREILELISQGYPDAIDYPERFRNFHLDLNIINLGL